MKYQHYNLVEGKWVENQIVSSKNRKEALKKLKLEENNTKSGTYKLRKISE